MKLQFDFLRTLQAAGVLLEYEGSRRMGYMRLLKLLYIADRELLAETGNPLTGDHAAAMKYGPVLTQTHRLILGESSRGGEWDHYLHTDGYQIELKEEPGRGELTKREIAKLREVSERFRAMDEFDLSEHTHSFGEWIKHYAAPSGGTLIPWEDALVAQGKPEMVEVATKKALARHAISEVLGRPL